MSRAPCSCSSPTLAPAHHTAQGTQLPAAMSCVFTEKVWKAIRNEFGRTSVLTRKTAIMKQAKRLYEFGPYRVDAEERLLLKAGKVVPLSPKVFDILLAFVERSGRVLDKDELMQEVW